MHKLIKKFIRNDEKSIAYKEFKFVCQMHPEIVSDKPSSCPKCDMKLDSINEMQNNNEEEHGCCG